MKLVIALGGNALLQRNQPLEQTIQKKNIEIAAQHIAKVVNKHQVVISHGNGPQVGLLALQNDAYKEVLPYTLDVLGAESEGMIGYLLAQSLRNCTTKEVVALLTQTEVDINDPAFKNPTKFIGPVYSQAQAELLKNQHNWNLKQDGSGFRRVVASPMPKRFVEQKIITQLVDNPDNLLICAGGGGIPVGYNQQNALEGIEAVVDKDFASCLLAQSIGADAFIMLTDVSCVETNYHQANSEPIGQIRTQDLKKYDFPKGSMGPKVKAAIDFVDSGGSFAAIGRLDQLEAIIEHKKGTIVIPS